jgi:hypothetical protein
MKMPNEAVRMLEAVLLLGVVFCLGWIARGCVGL